MKFCIDRHEKATEPRSKWRWRNVFYCHYAYAWNDKHASTISKLMFIMMRKSPHFMNETRLDERPSNKYQQVYVRFLLKMFTYTQLCSHSLTLTFTIMQRLALTMFIRPYDRIHAHKRIHYHNRSQGTYWDVLLCLFFWRLIVWCMIYVFFLKHTHKHTASRFQPHAFMLIWHQHKKRTRT